MFLFFVQSPATLIHFVMLVAMYPLQPYTYTKSLVCGDKSRLTTVVCKAKKLGSLRVQILVRIIRKKKKKEEEKLTN